MARFSTVLFGCQLFEIFAQQHLAPSGYAAEYHDHPTLQIESGAPPFVFEERSPLNARNAGNQTLPNDGVKGLTKSHLSAGACWDLGEPDDPERGVLLDTRLGAGEQIAGHSYADWHAIFVLDGGARLVDRDLSKNDALVIEPSALVGQLTAGAEGVHLLEVSRTAAGAPRQFHEP
jgi:hypothetical protein